jgi:hypothetical protein
MPGWKGCALINRSKTRVSLHAATGTVLITLGIRLATERP